MASLASALIQYFRTEAAPSGSLASFGIKNDLIDYAPVDRKADTGTSIGISVPPGIRQEFMGGGRSGPMTYDVTIYVSANAKARRDVENVAEAVTERMTALMDLPGAMPSDPNLRFRVIGSDLVSVVGDEPEDLGLNTHELDFEMMVTEERP